MIAWGVFTSSFIWVQNYEHYRLRVQKFCVSIVRFKTLIILPLGMIGFIGLNDVSIECRGWFHYHSSPWNIFFIIKGTSIGIFHTFFQR